LCCWRFIREFEDTWFSAPQMPDFIAELEEPLTEIVECIAHSSAGEADELARRLAAESRIATMAGSRLAVRDPTRRCGVNRLSWRLLGRTLWRA
jgi:hypothetical protein